MDFPEKLFNLRKSQNLSQKELAKRLGVSQASVNYWEKGQRTPSIDAARTIAEYFNIDTSALLNPSLYDSESTTLLGKNVEKLRKRKGYSLKDLSQLTGIPEDIIKKYETNVLTPKNNNIIRLASILDPDGSELLGYGPEEELPFCLFKPGENVEDISFQRVHVKENDTIRDTEIDLINNFRELNEQGQFEANKRVAELTEIVRYLKIKDDNSDK